MENRSQHEDTKKWIASSCRQVPVLHGRSCPSPSDSILDCKSVGSHVSARSSRIIAGLKEQHRVREQQLQDQLKKARMEAESAKATLKTIHRSDAVSGSKETDVHLGEDLKPKSSIQVASGSTRAHYDDRYTDEDHLSSLISNLQLPKVKLTYFDGNPAQYLKFVKQFEYFVESKVRDPGQRMLQLLNYCKGKAYDAIEECTVLPPSQAYTRARSILEDLYGQPHIIARNMIDQLMEFARNGCHTPDRLYHLGIRMQNVEITLEQLRYMADLNAMHTLEALVRKLPSRLQHRWADKAASFGYEVSFSDLTDFVIQASKVANSRFGQIAECASSRRVAPETAITRQLNSRTKIFTHDVRESVCRLCKLPHELSECSQFLALDVKDRWSTAKRLGLCFTCLKDSHVAAKCRSRLACSKDGCQKFHHPHLHLNAVNHPNETAIMCTNMNTERRMVSLGIVPVLVSTPRGLVKTLAFIDSGSNSSLVRHSFLKRIGIEGTQTSITISTLHGAKQSHCRKVNLNLLSIDRTNIIEVEDAFSVEDIPVKPAYSVKVEAKKWPHLSDLEFAEVDGGEVDILLGCDVPEAHLIEAQRVGAKKQPFASLTPFGWVMFGPSCSLRCQHPNINITHTDEGLIESHFKRLYDMDFSDTSASSTTMSREDNMALQLANKQTRLVDGHFEVPLPWKLEGIPSNLTKAHHRAVSLKARFQRDDVLRQRYSLIMQSHIDKGYLELAPTTLSGVREWYMPHHPVFNPKKPEKLRIVFDCAARYQGVSLNDALYQGPDLTSKLVYVLLRFRSHPIAVAADIEEMFLQVRVPEADRDALRVIWWPEGRVDEEPLIYRMTVHPFGVKSSPFCANFALKSCKDQFSSDGLPTIAAAVDRHFYVDDCLASLPDVATAKLFVREISTLLSKGGFHLNKWMSSSRSVLDNIASSERAASVRDLGSGALPLERTLGIEWDAEDDHFVFRFQLKERPLTRRGLLSTVSGLYDPLGFVAPWLLPGKMMLQDLCRKKIGWDDTLSSEDLPKLTNWLNGIRSLQEVHVPRHVTIPEGSEVELHLFSDASETGYGAVAYLRVSQESQCRSHLLYSKARVAPLKAVSIPRLELSAAVLAVRIYILLKDADFISFKRVYFWTDSMIVLYYIRNLSTRFCTFVANRLAVIHDETTPDQWRHAKSEHNPADFTSRGLLTLSTLQEWLSGPRFLLSAPEQWPAVPVVNVPDGVELKRSEVAVHCAAVGSFWEPLWSRFSCWYRLLSAVAWLLRFKAHVRNKSNPAVTAPCVGVLKLAELKCAELSVVRLVQRETFAGELNSLSRGETKVNSLRKLRPILVDNILRVSGRLSSPWVQYDTAYPVLLPRRHPVTRLIIRHLHFREGHLGPAHVLACLREKYWIPHGLAAVKEELRTCVVCRKWNVPSGNQLMAPLPEVRATPGWHPFSDIGVDYFGPFFVKHGRSLHKRYGCIFSCLKSRAVHVEVAHTLDTQSFLMALTRFVGRRGYPMNIFSDNGTNFVGAEKELKKLVQTMSHGDISKRLGEQNIQWHFIPPYASHRGGSWERIIKSIRRVLRFVLSEQHPTEESLETALIEVERILNNRPIVPSSSDDPESIALTPNHLLLLRGNQGVSPGETTAHVYHTRLGQARHLAAAFWKRWSREYLATLHARPKWLKKARNFKEDDVVLIVNEACPRDRWPLGVVLKCYPSEDGLVRTVDIRTRDGVVKRDVRKVCLLEGADGLSRCAVPGVDMD